MNQTRQPNRQPVTSCQVTSNHYMASLPSTPKQTSTSCILRKIHERIFPPPVSSGHIEGGGSPFSPYLCYPHALLAALTTNFSCQSLPPPPLPPQKKWYEYIPLPHPACASACCIQIRFSLVLLPSIHRCTYTNIPTHEYHQG